MIGLFDNRTQVNRTVLEQYEDSGLADIADLFIIRQREAVVRHWRLRVDLSQP
jgi:hypothetical protein